MILESHAWGHEGGNGMTGQIVNPGVANQPLSVSMNGNALVVSLATNETGAPTSTAAQVVAAINANADAAAHAEGVHVPRQRRRAASRWPVRRT